MIKNKNFVKKQKINWLKIFKNKTFTSWCKYNCIVLILGISLLLNIIYLPKILNETTNQNNNVTTIQINAINGQNTILPKTTYITNFTSLGDLLSAFPSNVFKIKVTELGRMLIAVNNVAATNNKFWQIEYWNGKEFINFSIRIDDIKLKNNEILQFNLK